MSREKDRNTIATPQAPLGLTGVRNSAPLAVISTGLGILFLLSLIPGANAQMPPLFPPPFPWFNESPPNAHPDSADDRTPPQVEIVTTRLHHGKNVLVVNITDESFITSRQVKYVYDGRIAFADLARDHDNVYYALINVEPPTSVVEIDVIDSAKNRAIIVEEITVGPPAGFYDIVTRVLTLIDDVVTEVTNRIGSIRGQ
jgi:hypothetical protein